MFAIIALVVGFVIALYALRAQQSDVADVRASNKPGDDTESNELELSRVMGRSREKIYATEWVKQPDRERKQDHIQYSITLGSALCWIGRSTRSTARAISIKNSYAYITRQLFGTGEKSGQKIDREQGETQRDLKEKTAATERGG